MEKAGIKFWGVRGSLASPGKATVKYGGNTPCVEISYKKTLLICDAGTGIRPLGQALHKRAKRIEAAILLSHLHLDHVIGLPFFEPLYKKGSRFTIICPGFGSNTLRQRIKNIIGPPYFPVNILGAGARLAFKGAQKKQIKFGCVTINTLICNHPDRTSAFKMMFPNGRSIVYMSDNEPPKKGPAVLHRWLKGADMLIHDSQYTPNQYKKKIGWGHSSYTYPIELAAAAGVRRLVLFHYDPAAGDKELDQIEKKAKRHIRRMGYKFSLILSREGMKLTV